MFISSMLSDPPKPLELSNRELLFTWTQSQLYNNFYNLPFIMTFSNFTEELKPYLKSVRVLKDYVSFDLYLSSFWSIPKKFITDGIEVINQENSDRPDSKVYSFVVKNERQMVDSIEKAFKNIVSYNKEKEEKERLFKQKIQELKSMFESKGVDELKTLHFEMEEEVVRLGLKDENLEEDGQGTEGHDDLVQEREAEG
jgi:hypothetical protein